MTKAAKQIEKLRTENYLEWETVEALLQRQGFSRFTKHTGSHFSYTHPLLAAFAKQNQFKGNAVKYAPDGTIVVVMHHGRVYKPYLIKIADAIDDIENFSDANQI